MASTANLLIATFSSLGDAYVAADRIAGEGLLLMEIFPLGSHGHFVFESDRSLDSQKKILETEFGSSLKSCHSIRDCSMKIVDAYLSKDLATPQESMLVAESQFIGELFLLAQAAEKAGAGILDLRLLRGTSFSSHLILTGAAVALKDLSQAAGSAVRTRVLPKPSSALRDLFQIQP